MNAPAVADSLHSRHVQIARSLIGEADAHDGLIPVDLERFWAEQAVAMADPFGDAIPVLPFGAHVTWECVFDELGVEEDHWRYNNDREWRASLVEAYNDKAERVIGVRPLPDVEPDPTRVWPAVKGLHDVFEAENVWRSNSWWLEQSAHDEAELEALLDRVDRRDVASFILPDDWQAEKRRLTELGVAPPRYRFQRGPVTFATSVYGAENLIFLIMENPELAARFRDTILRVMIAIADALDREAGDVESAPHGFYVCDDNCALLNPRMYEFFGFPILDGLFRRFCPDAADLRGQHSDSSMAHLLPVLGRLGLTSVNFGPTLTVQEIRAHCPKAVIHGQLAPFTYSRNLREQLVLELLRDFEMARAARGVVFATAGSVNNGTRLTSQRLLMGATQRYCRFATG